MERNYVLVLIENLLYNIALYINIIALYLHNIINNAIMHKQ